MQQLALNSPEFNQKLEDEKEIDTCKWRSNNWAIGNIYEYILKTYKDRSGIKCIKVLIDNNQGGTKYGHSIHLPTWSMSDRGVSRQISRTIQQ
jgi:hypothetical protein